MKKIGNFFKNFFVKKWLFWLIILIIVLVFFIFFHKNNNYQTVDVKYSNFLREVSVVGTVIPAQETNMAFDVSGRVSSIYKKVGDKVYQGERILSLESNDVFSKISKAKADYEGELAQLNKLKNNNSTTDLIDIKNAIRTGYTVVDDAIRSKVDQAFDDPNLLFPKAKFFIYDSDTKNKVENGRVVVRKNLNDFAVLIKNLNNINSVDELKEKYVPLAKEKLNQILDFLDIFSFALSTSEAGSGSTQADLDKYSSDVSVARTNVNKVINDLNTAVASVADNTQEIPYQEARVKSALANVGEIEAQLSKNTITAPFDGIVTKIDVELGEIVGNTQSAISIISDKAFQIETFIPEINIKDLQVGYKAKVTLDAFGKTETFDAMVISIEPAQTVKDGVSTYKTKFEFQEKDQRIRSGMTANVVINTENRNNVISLPADLIYKKDGFDYVKVLVGKSVVEKQVTTGNFDSFGNKEIISGLSIGEKVIRNPLNIK